MDLLKFAEKAGSRNLSDASALEDYFEVIRLLESEDFDKAHELNKRIRRLSAGYAKEQHSIRMYELNKRSILFDAPHDFDAFMQYIEWNREPSKRFYLPRRRVLRPIVQAFQEINDGKLDLLTVSQPKRTGKSTVGEWFGLFRAGRAPHGSSIFCGAGNDLVKSFYNGILDVLQKPEEYLFYDVFPQAQLASTNADEKTIHLDMKKRFATITCRSIDGALTGSTEATPEGMLYMDDLVSDEVEANNRNRLDTLWDKVRGDLLGRRLEGCPIVSQGTRYSVYDPIGRLQEIAPTMGWRTKVLEIPALDPITDESNFEIVVNGKPMFTTEYYRHERELVTPVQWASQFQQEPFEAKGLLFPENELNRYFELPVDVMPDAVLAVGDTAEGGGDSVMMPVAYIYGEDVFIEDCVFDNSTPDITKPQCAKLLVKHKVGTAVFESNSAGMYYARDVEELVKNNGGRTSIRTRRTITNKQTRIELASDNIKKHFWFKDKSLYKSSDQYGMMMKELTTYVRTGKVKHDDAPDGLSLLENEIRNLAWNSISVQKRPF
ncbi:MAG: phage terminase large subunit [Clostridiales bacterium]|nr:phage terminase large subunit [Clostridiales bacterium]